MGEGEILQTPNNTAIELRILKRGSIQCYEFSGSGHGFEIMRVSVLE